MNHAPLKKAWALRKGPEAIHNPSQRQAPKPLAPALCHLPLRGKTTSQYWPRSTFRLNNTEPAVCERVDTKPVSSGEPLRLRKYRKGLIIMTPAQVWRRAVEKSNLSRQLSLHLSTLELAAKTHGTCPDKRQSCTVSTRQGLRPQTSCLPAPHEACE